MKKSSKPVKTHKPTKAMVAALEAARKKKAVDLEVQAQALRDSTALGIKIAAEESAARIRVLAEQSEPIVESWWTKFWK